MKHRLFKLAVGLSLILTVAICVMWVRSYRQTDRIAWTRVDGVRSARTAQGRLVVAMNLADWSKQPPNQFGVKYSRDNATTAEWDLLSVMLMCSDASVRIVRWEHGGFGWSQRSSSGGLIATAVAPFWSVATGTMLLPLGIVGTRLHSRVRVRRRKNHGLCGACGYDLRASPRQCPECGRKA